MCNRIKPKLYVVVPVFNEEQILLQSLCKIESKLSQMIQSGSISSLSELLLVDDGSSDGTWDIAKLYAKNKVQVDSPPPPPAIYHQ